MNRGLLISCSLDRDATGGNWAGAESGVNFRLAFATRTALHVLPRGHAFMQRDQILPIFPHCLKVLSPSRARGALPQGGKIAFLCATGKGAMALRRIGPAQQGATSPRPDRDTRL